MFKRDTMYNLRPGYNQGVHQPRIYCVGATEKLALFLYGAELKTLMLTQGVSFIYEEAVYDEK